MVRIGILGAGWMGAQHALAYAAMDDVEIAGVAGRGPTRAGRLAERLGIPDVAGWQALLDDPTVDAIDVCVPTSEHERVCLAALEAGKHVLCETPLAHTADVAAALARRACDVGRHLQVALLMRFARPATDLHDIVANARLGAPYAAHFHRWAPGTGGAHHGDVLEEILLFDLDTAVRTFGLPRRVLGAAVRGPTGRIDHATAVLECRSCLVTCEASYLHPPGGALVVGLDAWFEQGHVQGRFTHAPDGPPKASVVTTAHGDEPASHTDLGPDPVVAECRRFADVVSGRAAASLLDAAEAVQSLRVLDALRASIMHRAWADVAGG